MKQGDAVPAIHSVMPLISPSLLSADFGNLQRDIEMLNSSECDWFHLDVMDGVFVPNISFGFPVMEAMAQHAKKPLDIHLMIVQPEKFIHQVKALGAHVMNVHYEACTHLHRVVQQIKGEGMLAGVTLNPHTPVSVLEDIIGEDRKSTRLNSSHLYLYLVCRLLLEKNIFLMIRRPPRSTLFPSRRSSDLIDRQCLPWCSPDLLRPRRFR